MDNTVTEKQERVLILEDDEERKHAFLRTFPQAVIVRSALQCIVNLEQSWDRVFLDHDLGAGTLPGSDAEDCGMVVVRFIIEHKPRHLKSALFTVHSTNTYRGRAMTDDLQRAGYQAQYRPFTDLRLDLVDLSE